jgi:hypothetical protein
MDLIRFVAIVVITSIVYHIFCPKERLLFSVVLVGGVVSTRRSPTAQAWLAVPYGLRRFIKLLSVTALFLAPVPFCPDSR